MRRFDFQIRCIDRIEHKYHKKRNNSFIDFIAREHLNPRTHCKRRSSFNVHNYKKAKSMETLHDFGFACCGCFSLNRCRNLVGSVVGQKRCCKQWVGLDWYFLSHWSFSQWPTITCRKMWVFLPVNFSLSFCFIAKNINPLLDYAW
jgi:hypothetical protein